MEQIATANIRNGEVKAQGDRKLLPAEVKLIKAWIAERVEVLARRDVDDILRTVDHLNLTTQWVQSKASDEQVETVADALLLAMHDLRAVLVRRKAEVVMQAAAASDGMAEGAG